MVECLVVDEFGRARPASGDRMIRVLDEGREAIRWRLYGEGPRPEMTGGMRLSDVQVGLLRDLLGKVPVVARENLGNALVLMANRRNLARAEVADLLDLLRVDLEIVP